MYVRKEIVHNKHVVARLRERGAIFVEEHTEVPEGAVCVFSAHGVAPSVREGSIERGLHTICPTSIAIGALTEAALVGDTVASEGASI